ncbi:hypothetical protein [Nonomuraea diastatica]|uniref:Uncharacterized protein n=1 Tax=Nonomuraea diastatica TaxID=1848329 RepID=A0A4V2YEQ6_9ACTN|nr:hypothetical protein [Nonomuraea diastatica]TDD20256.1 hypothetical protein E1294_18305 [Nonomuraea diastatica]
MSPVEDLRSVAARMARREARLNRLIAPDQPPGVIRPPAPDVVMRVVPCPVCGAAGADPPFDHWSVTGEQTTLPTLAVLGCEWLTPRAVLPMAVAIEQGTGPLAYRTRAVARLGGRDLRAVDRSESWADALTDGHGAAGDAGEATLPAVTRARDGDLRPMFTGPHTPESETELNDIYLEVRLTAMAEEGI